MKKLALLSLVLIHGCGCPGVMAQTLSVNTQNVFTGIDSKLNYVKNPFGKDNGLYISTNNAASARDGSTDKLFGYSSISCDASAQNGYCEFELKPIVSPHDSGNCEFKGVIKGDGSLYRAQILDNSSVLKAQTLILGNNNNWREFSVNAPCQSTPKVRITQTEVGTAPAIKLGVYYGPATNIGSGTPPNTFTAKVSSTGVVTDETGGDWINGNCVATGPGYNTCSFNSSFFTQTPTCSAVTSNSVDFTQSAVVSTVSSSSVQFVTGVGNGSTGAGKAYNINISCTKTGADFVQPAVTAANWNFTGRTWTPTVSNLGAGSGTIVQATYDRDGGYSNICIAYTKDGTNGSGTTLVTYSMPPGLTIDTGRAPVSQVSGGFINKGTFNAVMVADTGAPTLSFLYNGAEVTGSVMTAGTSVRGCVRVPIKENGVPWTETYNALQLLGSVTSDALAAQRIERATVAPTAVSNCTVFNIGTGMVGSLTGNGVGDCTITFSKQWPSTDYQCNVTQINNANPANSNIFGTSIHTKTVSTMRFISNYVTTGSSAVTASVSPVDIVCYGSR